MAMESLVEYTRSAMALGRVPESATRAYEQAGRTLTAIVNREIFSHTEIDRLLGGNPHELLENNHRNHVSFILEVMKLNDFELLASTLPWVYRAYHSQGVDFDYFRLELQAWINAIEKTLGARDAEPIVALYEWMMRAHESLIELSQQEDPTSGADLDHDLWSTSRRQFAAALDSTDHAACLAVCQGLYKAGTTLPEIFQSIIYPVMVDVGVRWEHGEIGVAEEHAATAIVNTVLSALYFLIDQSPAPHSIALVASVPDERHEMGAWMMAMCLELDGWDVIYLGADTPAASIVATVKERSVDLVALSMSMPFGLSHTKALVQQLRSGEVADPVRIILGGGLFVRFPHLVDSLEIDGCFSDCVSAVRWTRTLREVS